MTVLQGGYIGARTCTGGPRPGVKGGMAWYLGAYREESGRNLGIYNCRSVRGGSTTSVHGEGRAGDWGTPVSNNWSWNLAELLRLNSKELGIQCIIHRRKIWSSSGGVGWRDYTGVAAHFDHLHIEHTFESANRSEAETIALFQRILGDPSPIRGDGHVIVPPQPPSQGSQFVPIALGQPTRMNTSGEQVRRDQADLIDTGFSVGSSGADGYAGDDTIKAIRAFQFAAGIGVDGIMGATTRATIHRVPSWRNQPASVFYARLVARGWRTGNKKNLMTFQAEKGLTVDGIPGPQTWTALWVRPT